jgi:hypothetical protein
MLMAVKMMPTIRNAQAIPNRLMSAVAIRAKAALPIPAPE